MLGLALPARPTPASLQHQLLQVPKARDKLDLSSGVLHLWQSQPRPDGQHSKRPPALLAGPWHEGAHLMGER